MSNVVSRSDPLTSSEITMIDNLAALATSSAGQAIAKTGPTTFANISTGSPGNSVYEEVPTGSGVTWTLAHTPGVGTLKLYRGGGRLQYGIDYTLVGAVITLAVALASGEILMADYNF